MSAKAIELRISEHWRSRVWLIALGALSVIALLFSTYAEIFHFWWTFSAYNHCILIIPIALFLAYEKRAELLRQPPTTSWWALLFFFMNILLWVIGGVFSIAVFQHAAGIGLIIGLIWSLIGNSRARVIAFPLLYLYFGVPEGEILVPYLRDLTADVVVNLLRATGIPVFMEGRYLTIPSGQFHVAKACSGINYLIATLAVGTVFAYTRFVSNWRRLFFMILAVGVPLLANGMRAYGIVMIAHLSNYKYAIGIDHYIYGWVFFGVVIFILFAIGNSFSDKKFQQNETYRISWSSALTQNIKEPLIILLFAITSLVSVTALYREISELPEMNDSFAVKLSNNWRQSNAGDMALHGSFSGNPIKLETLAEETSKEAIVWLQMVLYLNPSEHGELENQANLIFDEDKWQRLSGPDALDTGIEAVRKVQEYELRRYGNSYLAWTWYDVDGSTMTNLSGVKLALTKARLARRYRGGAQTILVTEVQRDATESRNVLKNFINENSPLMTNYRTTEPK